MRTRLQVLAALGGALLSACGGIDDFADPIVDGISCALSNCKESNQVADADLAPSIVLTQQGDVLGARVTLGYRANVLTQVRLSPDEQLTLVAAGGATTLQTDSPQRVRWHGALQPVPDRVAAELVLVRHDGRRLSSVATLPEPFQVLAGRQLRATREASAPPAVTVDLAPELPLDIEGRLLRCTRADGSRFAVENPALRMTPPALPNAAGSERRVDIAAIGAALDEANRRAGDPAAPAPAPWQRCDWDLALVRRVPGQPAAGLHRAAEIEARVEQALRLQIEAAR